MGSYGKASYDMFCDAGITIDFFCDKDTKKIGTKYRNTICLTCEEVLSYPDSFFVLIANQFLKDICQELISNNFSHDDFNIIPSPYKINFDNAIELISEPELKCKIESLNNILADQKSRDILNKLTDVWYKNNIVSDEFETIYEENQYFCSDIISMDNNTVYVDVGAYLGDSLKPFLKNNNGIFKKAICFELNKDIYIKLCKVVDEFDDNIKNKVIVVNNGISDREETITYVNTEGSSHIGNGGSEVGCLTTLDKYFSEDVPTLIKMDIEGSELSALRGGEDIIKKYKPDLAICIYHKLQDVWEIPEYLKTLVPEYKIYFRHHSKTMIETVCYATVK